MAGYATPAWDNDTSPAINAANLTALGLATELAQHPYGVCGTQETMAAKTVTLDYSGTLALFTGLCIRVKFSKANSATNPTLNVNGTGAIPIKSYGSTAATTWQAGQVIDFVYDGTNWLFDGIDAFTKSQSLSSSTAAKINALTGTYPDTPDAALDKIVGAISSIGIASGTYTGTGTYGAGNKNSLTFPFVPKLVIVSLVPFGLAPLAGSLSNSWSDSFVWMTGQTNAYIRDESCTFSLSGNVLSWYATSPTAQLNASGATYSYIALG